MDAKELLEAVVASPEDDEPRLRYADFLTERNDPRGELIRLQCGGGTALGPLEREARIVALLTAHRDAWAAADLGLPGKQVQYRRGFPDRILVSLRDSHRLSAWRGLLPPVDTVRVSGTAWIIPQDIETCLAVGARRLDLNGNRLSDPSRRFLQLLEPESPVYPELRGLALAGCELGSGRLALLLGFTGLNGVCDLVARRNGRREIAEALATAQWPNIRHLDAGTNNLRDAGAKVLASSRLRPETLRLRQNAIGPDGFAAIVGGQFVGNVRHLDLADNQLRSIAEPLTTSPFATELEFIDVSGCLVPSAEIKRVLEAKPALVIGTDESIVEELGAAFPGRVRRGCAPLPW